MEKITQTQQVQRPVDPQKYRIEDENVLITRDIAGNIISIVADELGKEVLFTAKHMKRDNIKELLLGNLTV